VRICRFNVCCSLLALIIPAIGPAFGNDSTHVSVLKHAFIPSAENVHGETRLMSIGSSACLQTILHSTSFRRGVREIQQREADVWARQQPGSEDSRKYRDELERVKKLIVDEPRTDADSGKPYTLMIDFTFSPGDCRIDLSRADVAKGENSFIISNQSAISTLQVSDSYMSRTMLIMTAAAFGHHRKDSVELLERAGWRDLSPVSDIQSPIPLR